MSRFKYDGTDPLSNLMELLVYMKAPAIDGDFEKFIRDYYENFVNVIDVYYAALPISYYGPAFVESSDNLENTYAYQYAPELTYRIIQKMQAEDKIDYIEPGLKIISSTDKCDITNLYNYVHEDSNFKKDMSNITFISSNYGDSFLDTHLCHIGTEVHMMSMCYDFVDHVAIKQVEATCMNWNWEQGESVGAMFINPTTTLGYLCHRYEKTNNRKLIPLALIERSKWKNKNVNHKVSRGVTTEFMNNKGELYRDVIIEDVFEVRDSDGRSQQFGPVTTSECILTPNTFGDCSRAKNIGFAISYENLCKPFIKETLLSFGSSIEEFMPTPEDSSFGYVAFIFDPRHYK